MELGRYGLDPNENEDHEYGPSTQPPRHPFCGQILQQQSSRTRFQSPSALLRPYTDEWLWVQENIIEIKLTGQASARPRRAKAINIALKRTLSISRPASSSVGTIREISCRDQ